MTTEAMPQELCARRNGNGVVVLEDGPAHLRLQLGSGRVDLRHLARRRASRRSLEHVLSESASTCRQPKSHFRGCEWDWKHADWVRNEAPARERQRQSAGLVSRNSSNWMVGIESHRATPQSGRLLHQRSGARAPCQEAACEDQRGAVGAPPAELTGKEHLTDRSISRISRLTSRSPASSLGWFTRVWSKRPLAYLSLGNEKRPEACTSARSTREEVEETTFARRQYGRHASNSRTPCTRPLHP